MFFDMIEIFKDKLSYLLPLDSTEDGGIFQNTNSTFGFEILSIWIPKFIGVDVLEIQFFLGEILVALKNYLVRAHFHNENVRTGPAGDIHCFALARGWFLGEGGGLELIHALLDDAHHLKTRAARSADFSICSHSCISSVESGEFENRTGLLFAIRFFHC